MNRFKLLMFKHYLLPETLPGGAPSRSCQPRSKQCQVLRGVSLSGNYLAPNNSDYDSILNSMCLWAEVWTGQLATRVTRPLIGAIKVSDNAAENEYLHVMK